jgi:hypothetical protein
VLLIPPGRDPEAIKSTLCRLYLIIALTASQLTISYVEKAGAAAGFHYVRATGGSATHDATGAAQLERRSSKTRNPDSTTTPPLAVYLP